MHTLEAFYLYCQVTFQKDGAGFTISLAALFFSCFFFLVVVVFRSLFIWWAYTASQCNFKNLHFPNYARSWARSHVSVNRLCVPSESLCLHSVSGSLINLSSVHNGVVVSAALAVDSFPCMLYVSHFLMFLYLTFIWSDLSVSPCTIYSVPPELGKPVSLLRTAKHWVLFSSSFFFYGVIFHI